MSIAATSKPLFKKPIFIISVVILLILLGWVLFMNSLPAYAPEGTDYIPVKANEQTTSAKQSDKTVVVDGSQLSPEVHQANDLDTSISDLDSVDVDYLDSVAAQNDSEAAGF